MPDANKNNGIVYLTRERLVELERELHEMKLHGRAEMARKIAEARAHGDLSENAENDAAKEEQQHFELRVAKLEHTLSRARIMESKELQKDRVYILSKVQLKDLKTNEIVCDTLVS